MGTQGYQRSPLSKPVVGPNVAVHAVPADGASSYRASTYRASTYRASSYRGSAFPAHSASFYLHFSNPQVEDEFNVPIALSAFRDKALINPQR